MSIDEYAGLQRQFGAEVIRRDSCYWRRVRPFFYRPILPVEEPAVARAELPFRWPFGCQYVVAAGEKANSTMNFILLDDVREYSLTNLGRHRRRLVAQAARSFQIRPICDVGGLKEQGHRVYLSFFHRTGYSYKSERQKKVTFDQWVDALFRHPKSLVLGGFAPEGLVAVCTLFWVNATMVCGSLFCETEAMKKNVGELMFHELRQLAAHQHGINQIYVRNYEGGTSRDEYYLLRGCKLVRKPARLEIPAPARLLIRWILPRQYALLHGSV